MYTLILRNFYWLEMNMYGVNMYGDTNRNIIKINILLHGKSNQML